MRIQAVITVALLVLSFSTSPLRAQQQPKTDTVRTVPDSAKKIAKLAPIAVTATGSLQQVFRTANPVLVVDSSVVWQEAPNGVGDLFRNLPGVDVTGVGPNQTRLMIRGQRGQRILLAEDGVRLNNSRRQQDFGELPAMTDINNLNRIEVVRGPASVLYGTDAIGGVVNQITTQAPGRGFREGLSGQFSYRYGSADAQNLVHGRLAGRFGRLGMALTAGYRDASPYDAPAGTFGLLTLGSKTKVNDTGVRDNTLSLDAGYDVGQNSTVSLRVSNYNARDAGFGYVTPSEMGDSSGVLVQLRYPDQHVTRVTAGYKATALGWGIADRVGFTVYTTQNGRVFDQHIVIPFGAPLPPTAGLDIASRNVTDIGTYGFRLEAAKILGGKHTLTYGTDYFLDHSNNSDTSTTTTTVFGPPKVKGKAIPAVPNASLWSGGIFAQADFALASRFTLGVGIRGQTIQSTTRTTANLPPEKAGISATNGAVVGAISGNYGVVEGLNLVATVGRAFRAPNLVERYFDGATPEGNGYQVSNPNLKPETSLNFDLGFKFRKDRVYFEAIYFNNLISDGIRIAPIADSTVGPFPAYQNQNIDRIRNYGLETLVEGQLPAGFSVLGHFTTIQAKNADSHSPVGDSYGSKIGGELLWRERTNRFFAAYEIRHQGERKDIQMAPNPVGEVLPAFTTHNFRAGARLPTLGGVTPWVNLSVVNLTNRLYSEASNTSFFRPEARRSAIVTVRVDF